MSVEIDRFESRKLLLGFRRIPNSAAHDFIFNDKTFSLKVPTEAELRSLWADAGTSFDEKWDKQ